MSTADNIKVSVIMPIYNAYSYLRPAMDSVLDQTLREIELICVDDGSTDHSLEILKEYQAKDSRVRIITENNAGPSWARNKGLSRARGEYIIFLDADDFYELTLLEKLYMRAESDKLDITITEYDIYNDRRATFEERIRSDHGKIFEGETIVSKNEYPEVIFQCTSNYVWNKLFRAAFLKEKELVFDQNLRVFEDVYFVITSLSQADRIGKHHEVLIHHRIYSEQSKNRLFRKYYRQVPELYVKIKEYLMHYGMYAPLSQSFLNLSASRIFKIYNVLWPDAKAEYFNSLNSTYAEALGWEKAVPEEIEDDDVRDFVAATLAHTHKEYLARTAKGLRTRLEEVKKRLKSIKFKKSVGGFFKRLFRWGEG